MAKSKTIISNVQLRLGGKNPKHSVLTWSNTLSAEEILKIMDKSGLWASKSEIIRNALLDFYIKNYDMIQDLQFLEKDINT